MLVEQESWVVDGLDIVLSDPLNYLEMLMEYKDSFLHKVLLEPLVY